MYWYTNYCIILPFNINVYITIMNKPEIVIIAGSRSFNDYDLMKRKMDYYLSNTELHNVEIVSGTANGADKMGERYALESNIKLTKMPADWDKFGKSAGYIRNSAMAEYSTHCVVFWDGVSKGTKHMIDLAKKSNLTLRVVKY